MNAEAEYLRLSQRLTELDRRRAVIQAEEAKKKVERERLGKELIEAGIDLNKPEEEMTRLRAQINQKLMETKEKVDAFELRLDELEGKTASTNEEVDFEG